MSLRVSYVFCVALAGCSTQQMAKMIGFDAGANGGDAGLTTDSLTYYKDILPLAQKHCTACHYPGGSGPFSMETYADVQPEIMAIHDNVMSGTMPPWKPASGCRDLQGARTITSDEQTTFVTWAAAGGPAGNPADAPVLTNNAPTLAWTDATIQMTQAYTPPSGVTDQYQCFILDPKLTANVDLIGYDVKPGTIQEVHHVLLYPASATDAQQLDDASPGPGWTCFGGPGTAKPSTVGGWVPGSGPVSFPTDTGITITAGQVLVMQVHYNLLYVKPSPDQTTLMLQYAKTPVSKEAAFLPILNSTFSVPPGATNYEVDAIENSPATGTIWGALPHAHTNAQHMKMDSAAGCMVDIPEWDFHWQQMYFFTDPLPITAGQQLHLTCTYDNHGSKPLTWGEDTTDEMCLSYLYVTQ